MKINGKQYKLTKRGQFFKSALETLFAGSIGAGLAYMMVLHWFG